MITPTVGRVVWYRPARMENEGALSFYAGQVLAAIICHVWHERMVNLVVFDANGVPHPRTSVTLVQDGDTLPSPSAWCEWMPYQKGQAARTEAAEAVAAGSTAGPLR